MVNVTAWSRTARVAATAAVAAALAAASAAMVAAAPAAPVSYRAAVLIDGARPGPAFQGIGAISGGGGNSRLLIDYPPRERAQILNYLFLPHFGASLQMLKLEIGGGGFSSDGSEPSVEAVKGRLDCGAGYEFWLARQALARNPAIKLYGLQWSAPAWVRDRTGGLWSRADVGYVLDWLRCARGNGLTVSYIGGWNEHFQGTPVQRAWFVNLRAALDAAGFTRTQIVAADQSSQLDRHGRWGYSPLLAWQTVAADMVTDPSFGRAVSILGVHDTCGLPTTGYRCMMAAGARTLAARTGKPLWEAELGATPATGTNPRLPGPGGLARALNHAYDQAGITGVLVWPLIDAIPPGLPHENRGLVQADRPWDGYYYVTPLTWVIAQTTQFTAPGWRYLPGASGRLPAGGSYDTFLAPGRSAWSMVAETSTATVPQRSSSASPAACRRGCCMCGARTCAGPGSSSGAATSPLARVPSPPCCSPGTCTRLPPPPGNPGLAATRPRSRPPGRCRCGTSPPPTAPAWRRCSPRWRGHSATWPAC